MNINVFFQLYVHANIETLYEYVPKDCLPAEFGGQCEPINILHGKYTSLNILLKNV